MLVRDLVNNNRFSYLKLVNSNADLNRPLKTVESSETPDIVMYMADGAILLTTAMYYKNRQDELVDLIIDLNKNGCASLVIKVNRFLKKLDKEVIKICQDLSFPLFIIDDNKTLGDVYQDILMFIWNKTKDDLTFALNGQKIFSNILLNQPSSKAILNTLSNVLNVDTALVDPFGNIVQSTGRLSTYFSKDAIRDLISNSNFSDFAIYKTTIEDIRNIAQQIRLHKIYIATYYPYYLLINKVQRLENDSSSLIIEQALFSIAYIISRKLNNQYNKLKTKEKILISLMDLLSSGEEEKILKYANENNIKLVPKGRMLALKISNFRKNFPKLYENDAYTLLYRWMEKKLRDLPAYTVYPLSDQHTIIIQTSIEDIGQIVSELNKHIDTLKNILNIDMTLGIGYVFKSYKYQYSSYRNSIYAIESGEAYQDYPNINLSKPRYFENLVANIPKEEIRLFCQSVLADLYPSQDDSYKDFRTTLKTWLMNNKSLAQTAKDLYLHRNTIGYRLNKCREILDSDLEDNKELFNLQVALELLDLI